MDKREKFQKLVSKNTNNTLARNKERIEKRAMLRESRDIAIKVLSKIDELGWSQKDLAKKMDVSPQQVNKIVNGKENLTLLTIAKLQEILDIDILTSSFERRFKSLVSSFITEFIKFTEEYQTPEPVKEFEDNAPQASSSLKLNYSQYSSQSFCTAA